MPRRSDLKSILIIGAGPIVIGQACEFDYSGAQACKALKQEGYKVVLVNSNPATIMTDPETADVTYIEPITWQVVERIIAKEKPDAILPTMGGQTALNCAMDLYKNGVLHKHSVELIGASPVAIEKAEDRLKFKEAMTRIGLASARSGIAHTLDEALAVQKSMGFPVVVRPSFTLGGTGGGIAWNLEEFVAICTRGLDLSPTRELLIEESLIGWKEFEMEVVRDRADNCIIVCSIENLDPMGIHTGDSITVAPAQTLTDKEYQLMRDASIAILREIGVDTGGSNVQFAINPKDGRMIVIEMNPRVSRSSALASKATGFPIAKVAAKLAVGYTLDELRNEITGGATPASFEPTIDYVVTKMPRFAFEKFPQADNHLTTQMKSVGEVMAIGRTFQESFQKALRGLEVGSDGLDEHSIDRDEIVEELGEPGPDRIWFVGDAFRIGMTLSEVFEETAIDPWFLAQIEELVQIEGRVKERRLADLDAEELRYLKRKGFSDRRLAKLLGAKPAEVRAARLALGVRPVFKRVDTCAAEFATTTAYMYSTYEDECEAAPTDREEGHRARRRPEPHRPGHRVRLLLRARGVRAARPRVRDHHGQLQPGDRVDRLRHVRPPVLRAADARRRARDRRQGKAARRDRAVRRPDAAEARARPRSQRRADHRHVAGFDRHRRRPRALPAAAAPPAAEAAAEPHRAHRGRRAAGWPRRSATRWSCGRATCSGGRAMDIVHEPRDLERYMREAVKVSNDSPVLLDHFLDDAIEVDVDCLADGKRVLIGGVMEHIEQAGVHSGDSACSLPPYSLSAGDDRRTQAADRADGARAPGRRADERAVRDPDGQDGRADLRARGQSARVAHGAVRLEGDRHAAREDRGAGHGRHRLRAAGHRRRDRAAVLLGQGSGVPVREVPGRRSAARTRDALDRRGDGRRRDLRRGAVQVAARRRRDAARQRHRVPQRQGSDKPKVIAVAQLLHDMGYELVATRGTAQAIEQAGIPVKPVNKVKDGRPHVVDLLKNGDIQLVITTVSEVRSQIADSRSIRTTALAQRVTYYTTIAGGRAAIEGMKHLDHLEVYDLQSLHRSLPH